MSCADTETNSDPVTTEKPKEGDETLTNSKRPLEELVNTTSAVCKKAKTDSGYSIESPGSGVDVDECKGKKEEVKTVLDVKEGIVDGGEKEGEAQRDKDKDKEIEALVEKIMQETPNLITPSPQARKRKVAMLLGYLGANYSGMQRNPGVKTIEEELEKAIFKAGGMIKDNFGHATKIDWMRCARTDKGVSALGNIVSLKLLADPPSIIELIERINSFLPTDIRILGMRKVNNKFNSKLACDGRSYEYIVPTYAFAPKEASIKKDWNFTEDTRKKINMILALFLGTHNYHNFTIGKVASQESAKRFMVSFKCGEAFISEGIQSVILNVVGQSFMLYQIRKMVGTVIAIMRCGYFEKLGDEGAMAQIRKIFASAFSKQRFDIPIAPSQGLLLDKCLFAYWNKKFAATHGSMNFDEADDLKENFKKYIYSHILKEEGKDKVMKNWVTNFCDKNFSSFDAFIDAQPSSSSSSSSTTTTIVTTTTSNELNNTINATETETITMITTTTEATPASPLPPSSSTATTNN